MWCLAFAALHLFWALGGSVGLASAAGQELATRRPTGFVVLGLYGVACALLAGVVVVVSAARTRPGGRRSAAVAVLALIGAGLALRGIGLEVLLAADLGGLREQVGPLETHWSQLLWNPWFTLGGILFLAAAVQLHRRKVE